METQIQHTENEKKNETKKVGGLLFVGSLFIGMAAGWYFGSFLVCMFAGMGLGFILMAVTHASQAAKK